MPEDKLKVLHQNLVKEGYDLPDEATFRKDMSDDAKRAKFHSNLIKEGYELPDIETFSVDMGFKKKVPTTPPSSPTTSVSSNGSSPTPPISGSGASPVRDVRGINPKLSFLADVVSDLNPNAPKLQPGQSVSEWGKNLTEYAKQYPMLKDGEPYKKEEIAQRLRFKAQQRNKDFETFMDEKVVETADLPEYDQNIKLYRDYLAHNEPEKLRQFDEKRNYRSGLPYGIGNLSEEDRQRLDAEFYDKALENKQRYLNIKWNDLKSTIESPEFQRMLSIQQSTAQEIEAMNKSYQEGNLSEENYRSNYEQLKNRFDGVSMQVDPVMARAKELRDVTQRNINEAEVWIKRYPLEAQRRLKEIADDAYDEAMYQVMPSQKAAANFTNQVGRGVTEFLANVVSLPQVFSQDDSYGATDRLADVSQQWANDINDDLFPIPKRMNEGVVNKDFTVNWDLVFPKTVRTLTDMGIMAATGTPAGMVATSFAMNAKDYYDEGLAQGMKPSEASQFSVVMGTQQALLELVNPEAALLRKGLTKMGTQEAVGMLTKGVPMKEVVKQVAKSTTKNIAMENTQEILQNIGDMTGKLAANALTGSEFDFSDVERDMKETILLTTIVAGLSGGGIASTQNSRSELEKRALYSAIDSPEMLLAATQKAVSQGIMDEATATKINMTAGALKQNLDALPATASETERSEVVNALFDKSKLMEVASNENLDPAIKKVYEKKIGELDAAVSKIVSKYIPQEGVETVETETPAGTIKPEEIIISKPNAEEQQSGAMRPEGEQVPTQISSDTNLPEVNGAELQNGEAPKEEVVTATPTEQVTEPAQPEAVKEGTTEQIPTTDEKRNEEGRQKKLLTKEAEVATNIPEAPPLTKVFVATSGNTIEENEMGNLVVKGKRGGILTGKERNKAIREYRKEKMTGGKRVTSADLELDNITEPEAVRYIAENSTSPEQLLEMMAVVEPRDAKLSGKDSFIADNMDAISAESWAKFGDTNRITPDIKKNYIRKNGAGVDQIAQAASYAMNPEGDGTEITPKDVIDFVEANQKGVKEALKAGNEDMKVLYDAFVSLTGRAPTRSMIADVKKEGADKKIEEDFGMEPESQDFSVSDSPQMKKRRFTKQVMADKNIKGTTKAKITEDAIYYLEQKNVISEAEARNTIRELGQEAADEIVRDPNSKINGGVRGMLTQILLRQYEEQGDAEKYADLQRWAAMRLTEMGAEIQTYAKWGLLRADYTLEGSILDYEKATGEKVPEHLREKFKRIADEISSLEKKAKELRDKQAEKALGEATSNIVESIGREEKKQPSAKKRQVLSPEKAARKKVLRNKFVGIVNDFTNIPRLLTDKEFIEYNKLILEEAAGDFKNFVKGIVEELGSKIRPYARELYKAAGGTELPELEKAYIDEEGKIKIPKEIIREVVLSGAKTADELVAGVLNIVQNELKGVTEREIKEAITEYGKTINPSKDQIEAEIRRLKRDGKLELGLEDAKSGKGVKRSGLQREKPSDYQRELMRKINEELKKYPQDRASVEKKWASALDRVKTHLKNTIADTQKRIQDIRDGIAEPLPSKKRGFELDEEAKALQEERDNLKKILAELEPKQEMSDEARVKVALAAAERAIAATADKINAQEFEYKKKKEPLNTPELVAARERLKLGKDVLNRMREESGFAEQHRYDLWKKRIQKRIADLQEKIDNKDFSVAPKKVMEINQEILELRVKADKLKFERDVEIEKARIKSLEVLAKLTNKLVDLSGVPKSLMASGDLSAPLRQGAILGVRHPSLAYAAGKEMFKQMASEEAQENWLAALHESEVYPYMKHSKLFLSEPSVDLKAKEEQFLSNLADRIPIWGKYVVKPSGRAYNGYLNKLRADVFTQFYYALRQEGFSGAELEKELKAYAKFINVATGRGGLGPLEGSALVLNLAFFSPRFIASRIQMLNPYFYYTLGPRVGWYAFKSFATYIGVASMTLYLIAAMFGGDDEEDKFTVELDPRSSDFGKLRWGDVRYDIWAGEQGYVRLAAQFLSNSRKSTTTGEIIKLGEGYKPTTRFGLIGDFLMNKRAPVPTAVMNALNGVTNFGEPTTWSEEVLKLGIPIYSADMYELYQADQADKILGATIPSLLGVGVSFQNSNKELPSTPEEIFNEMHNRAVKKQAAKELKEYKKTVPGIQRQEEIKKLQEKAIKERAKEFDIKYIPK